MGKRQQVTPTDDWQQLRLLARWPEQVTYELLRPVVLFGRSPAERAKETGAAERTLYRQADRFDRLGMQSLFAPAKVEKHRRIEPEIRRHLLALKAEHPAFRVQESVDICSVRFGRRLSHHTVKRILAEDPPPPVARRRFPPYHDITAPAERRLAVIRLHAEGWRVTTIAAYLQVDRKTVSAVLKRWIAEGVAGLDDKPHTRKDGVRTVDLGTIARVRELQENPGLGEWRVHAALCQEGIFVSPRTCGRIMARNRQLYRLPGNIPAPPRQPRPLPFAATRRHQYWVLDIRYLDHNLGDFKVYCISVLESYSRAILASGLSRSQDLGAVLLVFYAAVRQHGSPEALVTDGGGVFRAKQALAIYDKLGIRKEQIARRQPWQSLIETQFNVQRRMADWPFAQATTWSDLVAAHDRFVADFNYQAHWAHRRREDGRHSPAEVLGWVSGKQRTPEELHRIFYSTRFGRKLDRVGYCRFRHWRVYGEQGLADTGVAVWLYGEHLTVEFADEPLAQYHVRYAPDKKHLNAVTLAQLFDTPHRAKQLPLWALGDGEWLKVIRLEPYAPRRQRREPHLQARLFS
ncbi:MAG: helix-turn-helix domain-containing protein [Chloroflexota bacterium]|nr:helix-turn-helix domain-containing protein [Chloroflexota bacterium]